LSSLRVLRWMLTKFFCHFCKNFTIYEFITIKILIYWEVTKKLCTGRRLWL
jgi:hypothetical protein